MSDSFAGSVALVTGAGSGIGAATAELLGQRGARVSLLGRRIERLHEVAKRIEAYGVETLSVPCDISAAAEVERAVSETVGRFGSLQHAVNCAGIPGSIAPLHEMAVEEWQEALAVNLSGVFFSMKYEIAAMLQRGGGSIVNISSVFADKGGPAAYSAAKHGVRGLTRSASRAYGPLGIRINEVEPGVTSTEMTAANPEGTRRLLETGLPLRRAAEPDEIAQAVVFILSGAASYVTGAHLAVDGGFLA